ncbi:hypothetical protein PLICRDRAFT_85999, partial [Plicaturopsis crispa FD-325 SS-3]
VNLQHDCCRGRCQPTRQQPLRQEREVTTRTHTVIAHADTVHYVVNVNSLHNYQLIRNAIP